MKYLIYLLRDPRDNKVVYVGAVRKNIDDVEKVLRKRLRTHIHQKTNKLKIDWVADLLSDNVEPQIELIEECDSFIWAEKELFWINYYEKTTGERLLNTIRKYGHGVEKKVYQYDKKGNFIKEYKNGKSAAKKIGVSEANISRCINDNKYTREAGGYLWRSYWTDKIEVVKPTWGMTGKKRSKEYIEKMRERGKNYKPTKEALEKQSKAQMKPINQIDLEGNIVRTWDSQKQVRGELGFKLYSNRFGRKHKQHGYYWEFA